jgi:hypothetical protein
MSSVSIDLDDMEELNTIALYRDDEIDVQIQIGRSETEVVIEVLGGKGKHMHTIKVPLEKMS